MKTAQDIVKSLQIQPQFKKLQNYQCIDKVLSMFLPSLHRFVEFGYIKNGVLFFVLNHNAGKQEFDNSIKMIKDVLNHAKPRECLGVEFEDIRVFVTHKQKKRSSKKVKIFTSACYKERSNGMFDVDVFGDERLRNVAKEIRDIIKGKR